MPNTYTMDALKPIADKLWVDARYVHTLARDIAIACEDRRNVDEGTRQYAQDILSYLDVSERTAQGACHACEVFLFVDAIDAGAELACHIANLHYFDTPRVDALAQAAARKALYAQRLLDAAYDIAPEDIARAYDAGCCKY